MKNNSFTLWRYRRLKTNDLCSFEKLDMKRFHRKLISSFCWIPSFESKKVELLLYKTGTHALMFLLRHKTKTVNNVVIIHKRAIID